MTNSTLTLTVSEAGSHLRLGKTATGLLIKSGELKSVMIGGSRRVRWTDLVEYLDNLQPSLPGHDEEAA